jgi:2-polyprenyl-6-methoxyphenol hydroxylase-like FAD-dependent oxidoreductase
VAMYDSLQLAQQIVKFGTVHLDRAIQEYEKLMFPRAKAMIEDSAAMNEMMFSKDAPEPMLKMFSALMQNGDEEAEKV